MRTTSRLTARYFVAASALIVGLAVPVGAQEVAQSFDELRLLVDSGDSVYVTERDRKEQRARILEVGGSRLVVAIDGDRRELTEAGVTRIRQRRPDSLWNGAAIGAAAHAGVMIALASTFDSLEDCDAGCWAVNGLWSIGLGGLIGTGVDALIKGRKTIYEGAGRSARLVVQPIAGARGIGLRVAMPF